MEIKMVRVKVTRTDLWPLHPGCAETLELMVIMGLN